MDRPTAEVKKSGNVLCKKITGKKLYIVCGLLYDIKTVTKDNKFSFSV